MSLSTLINGKLMQADTGEVREDITRERVEEDVANLQQVISYWRYYPDKFIDFLCALNPKNTFRFFFYQRVYLRAVMRHKYCYCVFPRAYSKSFLAIMSLIIKCILYPGCRIFVVSGGKERLGCSWS